MTLSYYPFDNEDTSETQYSYLFRELQDSGVTAGTAFKVSANSNNMVLALQPGFAILRGHAVLSTAVENVTIAQANSSPRTDLVVLRLDPTLNTIVPAIVKGTAGAGVPALTQTDTGIYELLLAVVVVAANATYVIDSALTDMRRYIGSRVGVWSTGTRPATPRLSKLGFNTDARAYEFYDGTNWMPLHPDPVTWEGSVNTARDVTVATGTMRVVRTGRMTTVSYAGQVSATGAPGNYRLYLSATPDVLPPPKSSVHNACAWVTFAGGDYVPQSLYYKADESTWFFTTPNTVDITIAQTQPASYVLVNLTYEMA